jgi:hypothetical protein
MVNISDTIINSIGVGLGVSIGNAIFQLFLQDRIKRLHKKGKIIHKRIERPKKIFLAAILNFFIWGAGYWYLGRKRGIGLLVFFAEAFIFMTSTFGSIKFESMLEYINYGFFSLVISIILAYDAVKTYRQIEQES